MSPRVGGVVAALALAGVARAADIDGDGVDDLVLRAAGAGDHVPVLVSSEGGWIVQDREVPAITSASGASTLIGDFDGDGRSDVARVRPGASIDGELLRDVDGKKWQVTAFGVPAVTVGAEAIAADVDGDGATDLVLLEPGSGLEALTVVRSARDGSFYPKTQPAPAWIHDRGAVVLAADIDGDGDDDLVSYRPDETREKLYVLVSDGGDGWTDASAEAPAWVNARGVVAAVGDVDGDGDADLAFAQPDGETLPVLLSRGDGTFVAREPAVSRAATAGRFPVAGDFDGDGLTDLAMVGDVRNDGVLPLLLADGDGGWSVIEHACPKGACGGSRAHPPVVGDFDADGLSDLAFLFADDDGDDRAGEGEAPFPVLYSRGFDGWSASAWSLRPELAALVEGHALVQTGGHRLRHTLSVGADAAYDPSPADQSAFGDAFHALAQSFAPPPPPPPGPIVIIPPPPDYDALLDGLGLTGLYHGTLYSGATTASAVLALRDVDGEARGALTVTSPTLAFDGGLCGTETLPSVTLPVRMSTSGPSYPGGLFPDLRRSVFSASGGTTRDASLRFVVSGDAELVFGATLDNMLGGSSAESYLYGTISVDAPNPCDDQQVNFMFERDNANLFDTFFP